eukprot:16007690-Heterocapsa_arctica.AAC.1
MMFGGEMCGEVCPKYYLPDVDGADEVEADCQVRERRRAGEAASNLTGPAGHQVEALDAKVPEHSGMPSAGA